MKTRHASGRRPKAAAPDGDTRAAILTAARSVFARSGFAGASTREVARIAGVNNAMIYYHFRDKEALYRAVLADSFATFEQIWLHRVFRSNATSREKIGQFIAGFIRFQHANEDFRRIMSMEFASCSSNYRWLADNYFVRSYERIADILQEGMRNGELRKTDPAMAVPTLVGMILHSFIMRPIAECVTGKKLDLTAGRFGRFVAGMFFDGLCRERGR